MDLMVSLTKALVPHYLVGSEFYISLSADDEEEFSIPRKFLKPNVTVASGAELAHLFHTMKFWGLKNLPSNVIDIVLLKSRVVPEYERGAIRDVLAEFNAEFNLSQMYDTLLRSSSKKQRLDAAAKCGREDVLDHVIRVDNQVNAAALKATAEHGVLRLLQRIATSLEPEIGKNIFEKVSIATVASRGHSECLLYLLENGCKKEKFTCSFAAQNGHLSCLKIAREHGCVWNQGVADAAARSGNIDCLKYALQHSNTDKAAIDMACAAAERGQLECLRFLLDQGVVPTKRMCSSACDDNRLECLQLLRARGAPWDVTCARRAAEHGSLACLQFLLDEGCKVDKSVTLAAAEQGCDKCLDLLLTRGCDAGCECVDAAAIWGKYSSSAKVLKKHDIALNSDHVRRTMQNGRSEHGATYIRALFEAGYAIPQCAVELAAQNGDVECVEYICVNRLCNLTTDVMIAAGISECGAIMFELLRRYDCPWDAEACARTPRANDLDGLKFAHENGCPWDASTTTAALLHNGLECLAYALAHGCPCPENACELAAKKGLSEALRSLHEHGCVLTRNTCIAAATYKYRNCLTYAVTHGAPVDASVCAAAVTDDPYGHYCQYWPSHSRQVDPTATPLRMLQCARELDCPWDEATITAAITCENLDCLNFALQQDCPCSDDVCELAASLDLTPILECLKEYCCPWDERTCAAAAGCFNGRGCLQYAYENGCPWDESTTTAAVRTGSLASLTYALQNGCPCDADACLAAVERGLLAALKLLHEHGCPWDERVSRAAAASDDSAALRYCVEHGCPISKATMEKYNTL